MVTFNQLLRSYPSPDDFSREKLFREIGWQDLIPNKAYKNTCAIRMSYCLIRAGISVHGRLRITAGPHKGQMIEPGQVKLSNMLAGSKYFGPPKKFAPGDTSRYIKGTQGLVSFMRIPDYVVDGALSGHIDLVQYEKILFFFDSYDCESECYWGSENCWFWELKLGT